MCLWAQKASNILKQTHCVTVSYTFRAGLCPKIKYIVLFQYIRNVRFAPAGWLLVKQSGIPHALKLNSYLIPRIDNKLTLSKNGDR